MKKKLLHKSLILFLIFVVSTDLTAAIKSHIEFSYYVQGDDISFWGDTLDEVNHKKNLKDGVNCPRARFTVRGKELDWSYRLTFDASEIRLREVYLRYEEYKNFRILIGQGKAPYSFWFLSTISKLNFLERALPTNAFNPGFRTGLQVQFFPHPFTMTLSILGPEINNTIMNVNLKGHTPLAVNGRCTFSPIHNEKETLHFAVASIFQDTDSLARFHFRSFPEVQTSHNHSLVDTELIYNCKNYIGQEAEMAVILRSFTVTGEYYYTFVNRNSEDLNFEGFFVTMDYFLTGEHYIYGFKDGAIQGLSKIRHSYGAWQLTARYSTVDLDSDGIKGGKERNTTFGLNWIVNDNLRFMLNYVYVDTFPSQNGLNRHVNILALRCQLGAQTSS